MDVETLREGDKKGGFVALRAYDEEFRGTNTRSGSCVVLHLDPPHAPVVVPQELGTSEGKRSQRELKEAGEQKVSLHMVKIAALRNSIEGLSAVYAWTARPRIADLQKL